MDILLLIVGLALIIFGANFLTDGASGIAKRFGIPEITIGLTIVAIGTSMPELVVSFMSAIKGNSDMAIGNVLGSNMFNTLVILGITAIVAPVPLTSGNIRKDIPFGVLAAAVFLFVAGDTFFDGSGQGVITRSEGLVLLCFFGVFMAYNIFSAGSQRQLGDISESEDAKAGQAGGKKRNIWLYALMIVGGIGGLVFGGDIFLDSSVSIARSLGVSEAVIAVTLVAAGTSMPELATSIVAAIKGNLGIALGNVVGSNISNVFLVLGASAAANPLTMGGITVPDLMVQAAVAVILFLSAFAFRKGRIGRAEGIIFLILYGGYVWWLLAR